jgi:hypothetical protein
MTKKRAIAKYLSSLFRLPDTRAKADRQRGDKASCDQIQLTAGSGFFA